LGWVEYTKKKVVCQRKSITRYDRPLLILLSGNRARRRTSMITNYQIMNTWSKSWVADFKEGVLNLSEDFTPHAKFSAFTKEWRSVMAER
jgi:hypothetical protein